MTSRETPAPTITMRRGRPRLAEVAAMERAILATALDLFVSTGFEGVSMERVAATVGISRTTLYSRYPTKALLFQAVVRHSISQWYASPSDRANQVDGDIIDVLNHHVAVIATLLVEPTFEAIHRLLMYNREEFPELAQIMHELGYLDAIKLIAADIRRTGERDHMPARKPDAVAEQIITSIYGWYLQYRMVRDLSRNEIEIHGRTIVGMLVNARENW